MHSAGLVSVCKPFCELLAMPCLLVASSMAFSIAAHSAGQPAQLTCHLPLRTQIGTPCTDLQAQVPPMLRPLRMHTQLPGSSCWLTMLVDAACLIGSPVCMLAKGYIPSLYDP